MGWGEPLTGRPTTPPESAGRPMSDSDYTCRVLAVWQRCDLWESLSWRVEDGQAIFGAACSDLFMWGTADVEEITDGDLDLLESCAANLLAIDWVEASYLPELFCARKRGMRPQRPWGRSHDPETRQYTVDDLDPRVRALFDACGPVRDPRTEG